MAKEILQRLQIYLSKAIVLIDAFTEEPVTTPVSIHTASGGKVKARTGGCYLFLNAEKEEFEVEIESPIYQRRRVLLKADAGMEEEVILLYPSPSYPLKKNVTIITGKAEPCSQIQFYIEEENSVCKLIRDYQKGDEEICVFMRDRSHAGTGIWYIQDKEKNTGEYFHSQGADDDAEYLKLSTPLKNGYRKKDTRIFPAKECETDENGVFYLLLSGLKEKPYIMYSSKGDAQIIIEGGVQNQL